MLLLFHLGKAANQSECACPSYKYVLADIHCQW